MGWDLRPDGRKGAMRLMLVGRRKLAQRHSTRLPALCNGQWMSFGASATDLWHEPHVIDCILAEVLREIGTPHEHVCAACAIFPGQPHHVLLTKLILCSDAFPKAKWQKKNKKKKQTKINI